MAEQLKHLSVLQEKVDIFFSEEVNNLSYYKYDEMLHEGEVSERIALTLMDKFDYLKKSSIKELAQYVRKADKDLFLKLKDGTITLD